jgi:hypothetical protein
MSVSKLIVAAVLAAGFAGATPAMSAPTRVQAGSLTCDISAGLSVIIGSKRDVDCLFTPSSPGPIEHYRGNITKLGVDLGGLTGGSMIWLVYAPTSHLEGVLQGSYSGAAANATVGLGVGANALVGGFDGSVALQPVSVEGTTGLNVAVGVATLKLAYVAPLPVATAKKPVKHHHTKHHTNTK